MDAHNYQSKTTQAWNIIFICVTDVMVLYFMKPYENILPMQYILFINNLWRSFFYVNVMVYGHSIFFFFNENWFVWKFNHNIKDSVMGIHISKVNYEFPVTKWKWFAIKTLIFWDSILCLCNFHPFEC